MLRLFDGTIERFRVEIVATDSSDGDIHPRRVDGATRIRRQHDATGAPWAMLDQVHGVAVVDVDELGERGDPDSASLPVGDVVRCGRPGHQLAIWTADCAPLFLVGREGALVAAHGGWRGLADGVVDVAVRALGQPVAAAVVGPVIHPCCYAFGADELGPIAEGVHAPCEAIAGRTRDGEPALDVPAAVTAALAHHGLTLDVVGPCTGCEPGYYSHRVRADRERQATVGWIVADTTDETTDE